MNCPACKDAVLSMTERQGVEIDYCPKCRGVWLDRGELDKIIEKSVKSEMTVQTESAPLEYVRYEEPIREHRPYDKHYKKEKRRKSFLEELFD